MQGADIDSDELKGIIPRITEQIFQSIVESDAHLEYLVKVSYMEIYLERVRDLLARECNRPSYHLKLKRGQCSPKRQSPGSRRKVERRICQGPVRLLCK